MAKWMKLLYMGLRIEIFKVRLKINMHTSSFQYNTTEENEK